MKKCTVFHYGWDYPCELPDGHEPPCKDWEDLEHDRIDAMTDDDYVEMIREGFKNNSSYHIRAAKRLISIIDKLKRKE